MCIVLYVYSTLYAVHRALYTTLQDTSTRVSVTMPGSWFSFARVNSSSTTTTTNNNNNNNNGNNNSNTNSNSNTNRDDNNSRNARPGAS